MKKKRFTRNIHLVAVLLGGIVLGSFGTRFFTGAITDDDVWHASKVIGLNFSHAEIDSMIQGLEEYRRAYRSNREGSISNAVSPAIVFNPLPPDFEIATEQKPINFGKAKNADRPSNEEELAFYSVRQLAELLRSRKITSVELTKFFLDRLQRYDDTLYCVVSLTEALAMRQAEKADAEIQAGNYKGLLHGIPYGAKDLLATKQYRTTWGAMPYKEQTFDYDATVITKLEEAGAVLVAKLTLGALARGDVWYGGKTRNPWDPESGSSGSSAGSASAVAAGLVPFAIGTETLGSIVSPSTVCGTTGLRPTFGRVSRYGAMALSWSMDKIGPICRSAEDCAVVFEAIRGVDGKDPSTVAAPFNYDEDFDTKTLKIGYLKAAFEDDYDFKKQDSRALATLRAMGYELIPIELPPLPNLRMVLAAEAAAAFDDLTLSNEDDLLVRQTRGAWPNYFRQARFIPAVEYIQANRLRTRLIAQMGEIFKEVDVYLNPSWASSSLRITNYTGHPCVVLPNGFQENGRPTSITITGKLFGEAEILSLAKAFQNKTTFNNQHPKLDW